MLTVEVVVGLVLVVVVLVLLVVVWTLVVVGLVVVPVAVLVPTDTEPVTDCPGGTTGLLEAKVEPIVPNLMLE